MKRPIHYAHKEGYHQASEPNRFDPEKLRQEEMLINLGPQHPAMHGVLRLEVVSDGEVIKEVVPHIGYLHRCFEKHAEAVSYSQIIPYIDRMDYAASMNSEHIYADGLEKIMGLKEKISPRIEYIRVLVAELNRIASHFLAIGTYAVDIGATTPFLWLMRDREHILRLFEWVSGARLLYNYIRIGGLYYDLPLGFEERCREFTDYLKPKLRELDELIIYNKIFVSRTANIGVLPMQTALSAGVSGPMLRGSGISYDFRRVDNFSVYPDLDFEIPVGKGQMGHIGDCWDRTFVRAEECRESVKIIEQCLDKLTGEHKRTREFNPQKAVPRRVKLPAGDYYFRGESPRGELGFYIRTGQKDIPDRMKVRSPCFCNLSVLPHISKGTLLSDLIAIVGSIDIILGEVDR